MKSPVLLSVQLILVIGLTSLIVCAEEPPVNQDRRGVALKGHDPVAYFEVGRPTRGEKQYSQEWNGATWYFASPENRDVFRAEPEKYAPQYGGYCAFAVSQGHTADVSPEAWAIVDGKLYLTYSKSIQRRWEADRDALIRKADANWPGILKK